MKWLMCPVAIVAFLSPLFVAAQSDRLQSVSRAYSACIKAAAEVEKTRAKPNIERIKKACKEEYRALARILPDDEKEQVTAAIEQGLKRELRR